MIGLALHPHEGAPLAPDDLWTAWSWEPGVVFGLGIAAVLYGRGMRRLPPRAGERASPRRREALGFWLGWVALAIALISPLHRLGEALLSAHMAQHELVMIVAAPLLVLGRPFIVAFWGLPTCWRRTVGRWTSRCHPLWRTVSRLEVAWLLHAIAIIAWHVPALYQRTVDSDLAHTLQHSSFLVTALVFWRSVLPGASLRGRYGTAILSLFSTMIYTGGLGALLTLSRTPWYPAYGEAAPLWGLIPLEDQQLAGLIMWVPGGVSYLLATLWLVVAWLEASEARVLRLQRARVGGAALLLLLLVAGCETRGALSMADAAYDVSPVTDPARGRRQDRTW
jgi:putative membrane protein